MIQTKDVTVLTSNKKSKKDVLKNIIKTYNSSKKVVMNAQEKENKSYDFITSIPDNYFSDEYLSKMEKTFNIINEMFKTGQIPAGEFERFSSMLYQVINLSLSDTDDSYELALSVLDSILIFYNYYNLYEDKLFNVDAKDYFEIAESLFVNYRWHFGNDVDDLNHLSDVVFDETSFKKIKSTGVSNENITHALIEAVDGFYNKEHDPNKVAELALKELSFSSYSDASDEPFQK